jgi:putative transposase
MGARPSMGTTDDAHYNFASLECKLIERHTWRTKTEARLAVFSYFEGWTTRGAGTARCSTCRLRSLKPSTAPHHHRGEHGLPTVGVCVACATPPVDNPAPVHLERADDLSP